MIHRNPPLGQGRLHLLRGGRAPQILLKGVKVDRKLPVLPLGPNQNLIIHGMPVGEPAQIFHHLVRISPEVMGTIGMDQNPGRIGSIMGISRHMIPAIHHQDRFSRTLGQTFGQHTAGKASPHDKIIVGARHRNLRKRPGSTLTAVRNTPWLSRSHTRLGSPDTTGPSAQCRPQRKFAEPRKDVF